MNEIIKLIKDNDKLIIEACDSIVNNEIDVLETLNIRLLEKIKLNENRISVLKKSNPESVSRVNEKWEKMKSDINKSLEDPDYLKSLLLDASKDIEDKENLTKKSIEEQLSEALESENYELAANLRDKLNL